MTKGFDTRTSVVQVIPELAAYQFDDLMRYYSFTTSKNLSRVEAELLIGAGKQIGTVWEADGNKVLSFTSENGQRHAQEAVRLARNVIGQPPGSAIYFAVDFDAIEDATRRDLSEHVTPYFAAIKSELTAGPYKVGVYGSGLVCATLRNLALAEYYWLACAHDWQGTRNFTGWHIRQHLPTTVHGFGFQIDPDDFADDWGGFKTLMAVEGHTAVAGVPKSIPPATQVA